MTPKEEAEILHNRQRKQLWLDVFLEIIKKPNMQYQDAHFEASWSVKCFDQSFEYETKQPQP
jgi:hypothetical protein